MIIYESAGVFLLASATPQTFTGNNYPVREPPSRPLLTLEALVSQLLQPQNLIYHNLFTSPRYSNTSVNNNKVWVVATQSHSEAIAKMVSSVNSVSCRVPRARSSAGEARTPKISPKMMLCVELPAQTSLATGGCRRLVIRRFGGGTGGQPRALLVQLSAVFCCRRRSQW